MSKSIDKYMETVIKSTLLTPEQREKREQNRAVRGSVIEGLEHAAIDRYQQSRKEALRDLREQGYKKSSKEYKAEAKFWDDLRSACKEHIIAQKKKH